MTRYGFILLTKEKWWNRRIAQHRASKEVQAFVRRNTVAPVDATLLFFYVNHPVRQIRGTGNFEERVVGKIETLWRKYNKETVFKSYDEYLSFMQGRSKATFVRFRNLHELKHPIPLKKVLKVVGVSRLPRSGKYLSKEVADKLMEHYN